MNSSSLTMLVAQTIAIARREDRFQRGNAYGKLCRDSGVFAPTPGVRGSRKCNGRQWRPRLAARATARKEKLAHDPHCLPRTTIAPCRARHRRTEADFDADHFRPSPHTPPPVFQGPCRESCRPHVYAMTLTVGSLDQKGTTCAHRWDELIESGAEVVLPRLGMRSGKTKGRGRNPWHGIGRPGASSKNLTLRRCDRLDGNNN